MNARARLTTENFHLQSELVVCVADSVLELVADQGSAADHLADGKDTVSLERVDAEFSPIALGQNLCPVGLVGRFGPDLTICRSDRVERGRWCETLCDVHLLGNRSGC